MSDDSVDLDALLRTVPLFEDLKKGDMKKLLDPKHMVFQQARSGETLVQQDELDTEFYIVLEGIATAYRREKSGETKLLGSYGAGDFFGEMSAISHQPRSATVKADSPCVLVRLDVTLFQTLFGKKKGKFAEVIDARYRERALAFHLNTAPIFEKTPTEDLQKVAERAELVSFAKDDVIAEEGKDAEALYLVRTGIVKRTVRLDTGEEIVQDFLLDNSSFGEQALSHGDCRWRATAVAMSHVDVVKISRDLFYEVFDSPDRLEQIRGQADLLIAEEEGATRMVATAQDFDLLVSKQALKGTEALVIDLKRCTRCNVCVESCVAVHEDRVPRLSKRGIRTGDLMLSSACYNCKIPECMLSCTFGAIRRDVDGNIHIIQNNCVGCNKCEKHCPYGVIRMAHVLTAEEQQAQEVSIWESIPVLGKLFKANKQEDETADSGDAKKKKGSANKAKAIKCDLCAGLPFEACVYNCPCAAIERRSPQELTTAT